jgi:imidazoleglycerol-phosphate dehydratase
MTDPTAALPVRAARAERITRETSVRLHLIVDGTGEAAIETPVGFFTHMLTALTRFARFDLTLTATGDTWIDDHHTVEDVMLALGGALAEALGDRRGVARFGDAHAPLDEALARAVVDLSGRPWPEIHLGFTREKLGDCATENLTHALQSLAMAARMNLHVDVLRGANDHHKAEAAFKAVGLALRAAVRRDGGDAIPSTKGVLA